jgi:predicted phage gp36 major capsid-like protein
MAGMAKEPSVEEAIEIANRIQADRITAIRGLAEARQNLADVREAAARRLAEVERENAEQIAAAEREDVKQYSAAQTAGWSADELRKIGYPEPDKKSRVRKRQARKTSTASRSSVSTEHGEDPAPESREGDAPVNEGESVEQ